jgi:hypothetical protein
MPIRLSPTPQSSPYVEQLLAQPVDAFGRGAQNAQFAAQLANALAAGYGAYKGRQRERATGAELADILSQAVAPQTAPLTDAVAGQFGPRLPDPAPRSRADQQEFVRGSLLGSDDPAIQRMGTEFALKNIMSDAPVQEPPDIRTKTIWAEGLPMHQDTRFVGIGMPGADSAGYADYGNPRPASTPDYQQSRDLLKGRITAQLPKVPVVLPQVTVNGVSGDSTDPVQGQRARAAARVTERKAELEALDKAGLLTGTERIELQKEIENAQKESEVLTFSEISDLEAERAAAAVTATGQARLKLPNLVTKVISMADGKKSTVVIDLHAEDPRESMKTVATGIDVQTNKLPFTSQDTLQGFIDGNDIGIQAIDGLLSQIEIDPGIAGVKGTLSRMLQEALSITGDLNSLIPGVDTVSLVNGTVNMFLEDVRSGVVPQTATEEEWFDARLSVNKMLENSLGYRLARARKGPGRLNVQDIKNAQKDTKITGLTSANAVKARLNGIRQEFIDANKRLQARKDAGNLSAPVVAEWEFDEDGNLVPLLGVPQ